MMLVKKNQIFKAIVKILLATVFFTASYSQANTLQILYQQALENDPQYQAAKEAHKAGKELKKQARAELLPTINFSASYSDNSNEVTGSDVFSILQSGDAQVTNYQFNVDQTLFDLAVFYAYKQVLANVSLTETQYRNQQQDVIFRTAERYFSVLRAIDLHTTLQAEQKALQQQLDQTKQSYEVGLSSITDVYDAQTSVDLLSAQIIEAKGNVFVEQQRLMAITGKPLTTIAGVKEIPFGKPQPDNINEWLDLAKQNSLTLSEAQHNLRVADYNYKVKKAAHFPTVSFNWRWSNQDLDRQGFAITGEEPNQVIVPSNSNSVTDASSWNIQFNMRLFSGGRVSSERRQAYYQKRQQQFNVEQAERQLAQNVYSSFLLISTNNAQIEAYQQSIKSSKSALESTQAGYQSGTRNLVDVLIAQRNLYQAERNYATARYDYLINTLQLKYQTGILNASDINQLDILLDKVNPFDLSDY